MHTVQHTVLFSSSSTLLRSQLSATRFPYTTLFRSGRLAGADRFQPVPDIANGGVIGAGVGRGLHADTGADDATVGKDRKSTRLNSSHVAISYAVFCLKKKKKIRSVDLHYIGLNDAV